MTTEDDYWEKSGAAGLRKKGNLFDDSVDLEAAKGWLNDTKFDDDDDTISWDGTPIAPTAKVGLSQSVRYKPQSGVSVGHNAPNQARPNFTVTGPAMGIQRAEPSITDVVREAARQPPKTAPTATETAKMDAEIKYLKRRLDGVERGKYEQMQPEQVIRRIIFGKPYSLECYKGKNEKLALLDEAIKSHDGNAICVTLLFLKATLKKSFFIHALLERPIAVEHYVAFLKQHYDYEEVVDLLTMLGRLEEAAMIKYRQSVVSKRGEAKLQALKNCNQTHFASNLQLKNETCLLNEQISLLERQMPIQAADQSQRSSAAYQQQQQPPQPIPSIVGESLLTTVFYCCCRHYSQPENILSSPHAFRKAFEMTDKEFTWIALSARSSVKVWNDIEALFKTKNWLKMEKMNAVIPFDRVVQFLSKVHAPTEILKRYCELVSGSEKKLEVAKKFKVHDVVIMTLKDMKDRQGLIEYCARLKPNSQEWFIADRLSKDQTIKWKN